MGNSPTRSISYTPRMTQYEAYDLLPPQVQHALQEAVTAFDAYATYRAVKKDGIRKVLRMLEDWNTNRSRENFVPACGVKGTKGYRPAWPSTVVACKVTRLGANWTPTYMATQEMH